MATAISNNVSKNKIGEDIENVLIMRRQKFLNKLISKCPATMLADSRTDNVIGRIKFLISSINTIKFINMFGVPTGTMWVTTFFVLFTNPKIIIDNHILIAVENEMAICAVGVKINGNKAKLFMKIKVEKIILINTIFPIFFVFPIRVVISLLIKEVNI